MSDRAGEKASGRQREGNEERMLWPEGTIKDCELGDAVVPWAAAGLGRALPWCWGPPC